MTAECAATPTSAQIEAARLESSILLEQQCTVRLPSEAIFSWAGSNQRPSGRSRIQSGCNELWMYATNVMAFDWKRATTSCWACRLLAMDLSSEQRQLDEMRPSCFLSPHCRSWPLSIVSDPNRINARRHRQIGLADRPNGCLVSEDTRCL